MSFKMRLKVSLSGGTSQPFFKCLWGKMRGEFGKPLHFLASLGQLPCIPFHSITEALLPAAENPQNPKHQHQQQSIFVRHPLLIFIPKTQPENNETLTQNNYTIWLTKVTLSFHLNLTPAAGRHFGSGYCPKLTENISNHDRRNRFNME